MDPTLKLKRGRDGLRAMAHTDGYSGAARETLRISLELLEELRAAREELASWQSLRVRVSAAMADDEIVPRRNAYCLVVDGGEDDGDFVDVPVRADCLAAEIVRRCTGEAMRLQSRQRCGTCAHWGTEDETEAVRTCQAGHKTLLRTAESSCPDGWRPAQWLEPEPAQLPISPARLVRAALAWADEIGRLGNLHYTAIERELFAAANEIRGIDPGPGSEPTEEQIARARAVAADTEGTPKSIRRLAVAWLAQHGLQ